MRSFRLLAASMAALFVALSAVPVAFAATSTAANACFCYVQDKGAVKTDGASDDPTCATLCAKNGDNDEGHLWAKSFGQYPGANLRCWEKQTDCEANLDGDSAGTIDGQWSYGQPAECLEGSHYCYSADTIKTELQIEIAGTTSVVNFADYVGVVYNYLMGFAMTVAIVLLMVGGLRYVLGASSGDVSKAKKMMANAVEGFVLLMFAYVILYTVNPQLLKLQVPKLPMLRQVTIVSGNDCASIMGLASNTTPSEINSHRDFADTETYGEYAIVSNVNSAVLKFEDSKQRGDPRCGVDAEVLAGADGVGVAEGTTCHFNYCDDAEEGCATVKDKAECVKCSEIGPSNDKGIVPSAALCSSLDPADVVANEANETVLKTYKGCGYSHSPTLVSTVSAGVTAAAASLMVPTVGIWYTADVGSAALTGTCAYLKFDCSAEPTCEEYDAPKVYTQIATWGQELDDLNWPSLGTPNIQQICSSNPCKVSGGCELIDGGDVLGATDCVSPEEKARRVSGAESHSTVNLDGGSKM